MRDPENLRLVEGPKPGHQASLPDLADAHGEIKQLDETLFPRSMNRYDLHTL
jgi:hypothetical protein